MSALVLLFGSEAAYAQRIRVTGTVTSEGGAPLQGVQVRVDAPGDSATLTNAQGRYTINAPTNGALRYTFIGYRAHESQVGGRTTIVFDLAPNGEDIILAAAEQSNGRLLFGGAAIGAGTAIFATAVRLTANGTPDASFGTLGKKTYDFGQTALPGTVEEKLRHRPAIMPGGDAAERP